MPNQRAKDRPRIMFVCSQTLADDLQARANKENRSRSNLIETLLTEMMSEELNAQSVLSVDDFADQVKKYIALLMGERDRNGISYVLLGEALGVDPEKLHELYLLVQQCKREKAKR